MADSHHTPQPDAAAVSPLLVTAPGIGGTLPTPTSQPHSDHSDCSQTTASAAPPMAASCHSPPPDDTAVPCLNAPASADGGNSPATQPHSDQGDCSRNPDSAAPPMATFYQTVSRLRSLSADEKGRRLIEAAEQGAVGELEALLVAGADVGARGRSVWNETALHRAAAHGQEEAARRLLAAGAVVDARDIGQLTPLMWAAGGGHVAVVRLLLAAGADHSARNRGFMWTALHAAAALGRREVAIALLEGGADRGATDKWGRTPLDVARRNNKQQLVDLLQGR